MAKKRAKKAPARKPSSMGWIIAAIVVLVIIAFLVMKPAKEVAVEEAEEVDEGALQKAVAPEFNKKCTIAGGVVPGSIERVGNVVTATYKNSAKVANEGTYFEFSDVEGDKVYRKNTEAVQPLSTITYTVDLDEVAIELGSIPKAFIIFPVQGGKACLNQPAYVIK